MTKKFLFIFIPVLLILMSVLFLALKSNPIQPPPPQGQTYEVILKEDGFSPPEIEIKPGDSIKFTTTLNDPYWPASDLHPTHGIYPEFDPQEPTDPPNSWTFQFLKTGKWRYHDHLQPMFRGIITVQ